MFAVPVFVLSIIFDLLLIVQLHFKQVKFLLESYRLQERSNIDDLSIPSHVLKNNQNKVKLISMF